MDENILYTDGQPANQMPKRPQYLTILCILSFVWSGFLLLTLFLVLCFNRFVFDVAEKLLSGEKGMPPIDETQQKAIQVLVDMGQQNFMVGIAVAIIIYMTSLLGVFKMWRLQKWGFYIYAVVNGMGLLYDVASGSYFMAMITFAFISMYFSNFKHLK